ncbi:MAG: hypothetical protein ABMB14_22845 [Myxococcota bacterium]
MADRSSTLMSLMVMLGVAAAMPVVLGGFYSVWRAHLLQDLAEDPSAPRAAIAADPAPVVPVPHAPLPAPPPMRPVDEVAFRYVEHPMQGAVEQDVAPGSPFRIDLVKEGAGVLATGLTVDLDRNGTIDERWTFHPAPTRVVGDTTYRWADDGWVAQ